MTAAHAANVAPLSPQDGFSEAQLRAMERVGRVPVKGRYVKGRNLQDDFRFTGKVLGTGCSGAVLQAVDRSAEATEASAAPAPKVAIKNYDLDLLDDSQRQRLQGELEVFLSLDHPHIARLLYVYESDNGLSLVMECMEGGELYDRVIHGSGQPGQEAALATWHMLQAISYIHSTGVVHRDLKLENFLYDFKDSDFLKLIDFGFSKFFCMKKKMKEALGTIAYVAPEVLKKRYSGGSCDMWSLGVIVYVLLTGEMPFQGKCDVDVATAVMRGSYSWKASHRFRVCKEGRDFVDRLLVLDASKRHTAEEALRHPWLLSVNASAEKVHGNTVVTGFRNLAMASDFQRACLKAMAWSLSLAERRRLRGVFIDLSTGDGKDGSGIISKSHLQAYMRARIPKESDEGLEELAAMTANLPEEIHYSDFLAAMMASELDEHEDIVRCAFRHFDQEGSGNVTPEILTEVLGTDVDVSSIFREADIDQDGHISLHDFVLYLGRITELPPVETLASSEALQLEEESQPEKVTRKDRLRRAIKSWLQKLPRGFERGKHPVPG